MSIPGLPRGVRSAVYRRIVDQLRTDPVLSSVVKTWRTHDRQEPDLDNASALPALQVELQLGPVAWYSPDSQFGSLQIRYTAYLDATGPDALDALDFQEAIERAIYPFSDRSKQLKFEQAMRDLKCETGQITFGQPASPVGEQGGIVQCVGVMQVNVIRPLNP